MDDPPGLAIFSTDGQVAGMELNRLPLPAKTNALALAPAPGRGGYAVLAGGDDDMLRLFSSDGEMIWERQSTVAPEFKVGDRYQAPWFTDPERKRGIFSLLVADVTGAGAPEIVVGRPSTVEYWSLEGDLKARVPVEWGDCSDLVLLKHPDGPRVLVGKSLTGSPAVAIMNGQRKVMGNGYNALPAGATSMSAWMQQSATPVIVSDVDGDGQDDVLVVRRGHWNDVRLYDGGTGAVRWQRSFGAGPRRTGLFPAVTVADLAPSAGQEVAVGLRNGWLCCFSADGEPLWTRRMSSAVTRTAATDGLLAIGLADGSVALLDGKGHLLRRAQLPSEVTAMVADNVAGRRVLVGTAGGTLVAFTP